jgi:hypothetical protein
MYEPNLAAILDLLTPTSTVLDIGGWACPFNRANYVIDTQPYETRGYYRTIGLPPFQGGAVEHFTRETWIQRDLCDRAPFPFRDKEIDFAVCSQTLEDLRDPLWVCSEMIRVAKRGYIEVPSRMAESCRGWERDNQAGLSHHRWLIEIENSKVRFMMKFHNIHSHWRFSLPPSVYKGLSEERRNQWLFWEASFETEEVTLYGIETMEGELEGFVARTHPYPTWRLRLDKAWRRWRAAGRK